MLYFLEQEERGKTGTGFGGVRLNVLDLPYINTKMKNNVRSCLYLGTFLPRRDNETYGRWQEGLGEVGEMVYLV